MRPSGYWGNQVLNFVIQWNCCLVGSESHSDHFVKSDSKKLLSDIFHVITFRFPNITFIAISFISKMVDGVTYLSFAACLTAQQVNETSLQSKLWFVKLVNAIILILLQTWHLEFLCPQHSFLSTGYDFDLAMWSFAFQHFF